MPEKLVLRGDNTRATCAPFVYNPKFIVAPTTSTRINDSLERIRVPFVCISLTHGAVN